jgi:hypothetical protein
MNLLPEATGILTSIFIWSILFRLFFNDWKHFWECVRHSFNPGFFPWTGRSGQLDYSKFLNLNIFILVGAGFGYFAYLILKYAMNSL